MFPVCTLITPNIPEAEILFGIKILNTSDISPEPSAEFPPPKKIYIYSDV
ncbi:MAG: bifunctional hydroxymethylpyrimidine kinase/phosphomethylpyrimidine kinase [Oscillospiraceae bacterium]|nr:bifunctional hydroxymethylpyrimidine kinase/phosphomethylpyrimidine kinase [Oscillospiraceae bacterium]